MRLSCRPFVALLEHVGNRPGKADLRGSVAQKNRLMRTSRITAPGSYFSFMLGIGNVAVTTSEPPFVFTRAPVSQR